MGMGSKNNSSRTENLPTSNVGILVKNQFWSSLVTSLKKAKAHMIVEPKGVDVWHGNKPKKYPSKLLLVCLAPQTLMPLTTEVNYYNLRIKERLTTTVYVITATQNITATLTNFGMRNTSLAFIGTNIALRVLSLKWMRSTSIIFQIATSNISTVDCAQLEKGIENTYVHYSIFATAKGWI